MNQSDPASGSKREDNSTLFPSSTVQSLRRVFQTAFTVHDISEPLVSFDDTTSSNDVRDYMKSNRFEVVGVRSNGRVVGYVTQTDLARGKCADHMAPFEDSLVIVDSAPLVDLILRFKNRHRLFVSVFGQVGGIVSRSDLQKPAMRMWLFGIVTLIEMRTTRLIERFCGNDSWHQFLSPGRLEKAKAIWDERIRRHQDLSLLDCLQLSDKLQIVARNQQLRELTRFGSRRQMEESTKALEKLRNNLAHSQDIIATDWEMIVAVAENFENVLSGPPGLQDEGRQARE